MRDPRNDAGPVLETDPRVKQSNQAHSVAHPPTDAKRRAWLDDAVRETDADWRERHVLPLLRALGALRR